MEIKNKRFTFEISLSVLNHLGRNLYRSFMTVLGEAISNSWDADAENVWIYIDKAKSSLVIKDDGDGMTGKDFKDKFLKIGYSKRNDGNNSLKRRRPYIGRKGIGKLALLSCAKKISILTKTINNDYVGGVIDNSGLDQAIKKDLTPDKYKLDIVNQDLFTDLTRNHTKGTIIYFEEIDAGIKNSPEYLKKLIALFFRFSLLDKSFNIFVNDDPITIDDLADIANNTQFVWILNDFIDPFISDKVEKGKKFQTNGSIPKKTNQPIVGFIASVEKPSQLKINGTEDKVSIDLFVNGRLREKDILKHIPSTRIVESYLYGQIHYNGLDDSTIDRFTSSREGIVADDPLYKEFLDNLKKTIAKIIDEWDELRNKINADGDPDNPRLSKKERKSKELFNVVSEEYRFPTESGKKGKVDQWVEELAEDAQFNFSSYADCFISENLTRKYIEDKKLKLTPEAIRERDKWMKVESDSKNLGNISIDIRKFCNDLSYLSMAYLANLADKEDPATQASLSRDAREYRPMRDALAHTALLTDPAKIKLKSVYENIKGRIKTLLANN
jgi:hypothetical protein